MANGWLVAQEAFVKQINYFKSEGLTLGVPVYPPQCQGNRNITTAIDSLCCALFSLLDLAVLVDAHEKRVERMRVGGGSTSCDPDAAVFTKERGYYEKSAQALRRSVVQASHWRSSQY